MSLTGHTAHSPLVLDNNKVATMIEVAIKYQLYQI